MNVKKEIKNIEKSVNKSEKDFEKDIKQTEKWIYERRKFLIKLIFVMGFVAFLLIISHFFLRVKGVGI